MKLKDELQIGGFLLFVFWLKLLFLWDGTVLGCFSQCNFETFRQTPTMLADIFTQLPPSPQK